MHPALRERGRAIPSSHIVPKIIDRPPPPGEFMPKLPKMRPPLGGAGYVVPPKGSTILSSMGIVMPMYTIGIIVFFIYTIIRVIYEFVKQF